ncbi:protein MPE1 [Nematocida sp. AWRm80]|nr:protein MPE1 [Nematocida sp. AWRm80]
MQVFYRFRSEKEYNKIESERSTIPLWELKAELVAVRHLTLHDYHLIFYLEQDPNPITDNYTVIHANSKVIVERVPNYIQIGYKEALEKNKPTVSSTGAIEVPGGNEPTPAVPAEEPTSISFSNIQGAKIPPSSYVCYRCGQKGHFIQFCPTNKNKQYDAVRIRKATGIPKTFLVPAEQDPATSVLLNEEGKFVRAQPQTKEFSKHFTQKSIHSSLPDEFKCPGCGNMYASPMRLDCQHVVCEACTDSKCPVCGARTSKAIPDVSLQKKLEHYLENQKDSYHTNNTNHSSYKRDRKN